MASIFFHSANGKLLERMDDLDAGVADQDVDAAPGLDDLRDGASTWPRR
jgi:hypothetical protein